MHFKPIKEFLSYVEDCHIALADLYQRLSLESKNDKVKLLLEFMYYREQLSYIHLHEYVQQAPSSLLETCLETIFDQSIPMKCQQMQLQVDLDIEDVLALAMKLDTQLIELMQTVAYNSATTEAEVALVNLSNQEQENLHKVVMASNEFNYM